MFLSLLQKIDFNLVFRNHRRLSHDAAIKIFNAIFKFFSSRHHKLNTLSLFNLAKRLCFQFYHFQNA
uniref:Uncharacterized protein n=1 Tax=Daphnia magna TaxID=35525 RepID=A0A0P6GYD2_9CRUS